MAPTAGRPFRHITIPLLHAGADVRGRDPDVFSFQVFVPVYQMTQGGPLDSTKVLVYYIYQQGFKFQDMGYASALSVVTLVILVAVSYALMRWLSPRRRGWRQDHRMAVANNEHRCPALAPGRSENAVLQVWRRAAPKCCERCSMSSSRLSFWSRSSGCSLAACATRARSSNTCLRLSLHTFFPIHWTLDQLLDGPRSERRGQTAWAQFRTQSPQLIHRLDWSRRSPACSSTPWAPTFLPGSFPKKNWLLAFVLVTLFVPFEVTMVPALYRRPPARIAEQLLGHDRALVCQPVRHLRAHPVFP